MALLHCLQIMDPVAFIILVLIILIMISYFLSMKSLSRAKSHYKLPPGPPQLPIIGNLHQLGDMPHISLHNLSHKYGPIIYLQLGHIPTVVVSSARIAKKVLKTHDLAFSSRPQQYAAKHLFYNCTNVVHSPYGPYWRHIRKICILELLSAKRVQSYSSIREQEVARLVSRVAESYPGSAVDITKLLGLFANDVLCHAAFGRSFSADGDYDRHGFQKMLEDFQLLLGGFSLGDYFPSMEWLNSLTGMKSRLDKNFQRFDQFFDEIIVEHLNPSRTRGGEEKDLVDVLLDLQKSGSLEMPLATDNIKAIILDIFAAGTDTTSITLDWVMTELMMNPGVMEKAQTEVRSVVGDGMVLESDLPELHYLTAVIKETFRLHPPAPIYPRLSMEEIEIDGYVLPAQTHFFINARAIGRNPESWENPNDFNPERFTGSNIDFRGQDFELLPFGAGRRVCPGIAFAMATLSLPLARLLHDFDFEFPAGINASDLDMSEVFGITTHRKSHLMVVAKPHDFNLKA